ncbi:MAG: phosphoribosylanthranilate isomerase [Methanobacterium sp.]|uniref:phosphoribosylanthranilate isomerase n=1 Tax=Methanobacterium sp. TaxID=2164 RepID=UPI003D64C90A|nr:phosphoribosylanthranilate isomerase [Methanobacterium sp.]
MKVKICGITSLKDLQTCKKVNPAFIGFINIKRSKRYIDIEKIRELKDSINDLNKLVLVIEPKTAAEAMEKSEECGICNVQLHSLSADEISKIHGINIIKAIGISEKIDSLKKEEIKELAKVCPYLLFDFEVSGKSGGTGKQIPLKIALKAGKIAKNSNPNIKLIIAGGMNTDRIKKEGKVIKEIFDYVDVNSGIEDGPGVKNTLKIEEFMKNCKVIS